MIAGRKQLILVIFIIAGMSCHDTRQKNETAEEARERVIEATRNPQETYPDSLDEYELYTTEMAAQLKGNELKISSFKTIIKLEPQVTQDQFKKQIEQVELKNVQLKTILTQYKFEEGNKWTAFKISFSKQLTSLNHAIAEMDEHFIFNTSPTNKKY